MQGFTSFGLLHFPPPGDFRRNAAWTEKGIVEFDGLYFYYEKTKRSGAFIRGFTLRKG